MYFSVLKSTIIYLAEYEIFWQFHIFYGPCFQLKILTKRTLVEIVKTFSTVHYSECTAQFSILIIITMLFVYSR